MKEQRNALLRPLLSFRNDVYNGKLIAGESYTLVDENGKNYIDLISGLWNVPFGYNNLKINKEIKEQLEKLPFINTIHDCASIQVEYADRLRAYIGKDASRIFLTCSGSESIEFAIKVARKYQVLKCRVKKSNILIFDQSYHGTTYAAMSASGMDSGEMFSYEPIVAGFVRLETPLTAAFHNGETEDEYRNRITKGLRNIFEAEGNSIAAILIEPVIASGGIFEIPGWYVEEMKKLCKQYDVLMIADEVATGFMRTGKKFGYMRIGVNPDIICLSKSIVNGYMPFGAVVIGKMVADVYTMKNEFVEHFTTQNGNLIAPAAAKAVIDLLEDCSIQTNIRDLIQCLEEYNFTKLLNNPYVREVRKVGLMIGIDLTKPDGKPISSKFLMEIIQKIRENELLVYEYYMENHIAGISLFPPYIMKRSILEKALKKIEKCLLYL